MKNLNGFEEICDYLIWSYFRSFLTLLMWKFMLTSWRWAPIFPDGDVIDDYSKINTEKTWDIIFIFHS